jgi:hypothetical protein
MLVYQWVHEIGEMIIIHELGIPFSTSTKGRLLGQVASRSAKANLARDHNDEVAAAAIRALGDFGKEGGRGGQKWNDCSIKKKRANDPNGFFHHIGSWDSPANLGESRWVLLNKWG